MTDHIPSPRTADVVEAVGFALAAVGAAVVTAAAALVSPALSVLTAGVFLALIGVVLLWVRTQLAGPAQPKATGDDAPVIS
jgi:hypothetical protein